MDKNPGPHRGPLVAHRWLRMTIRSSLLLVAAFALLCWFVKTTCSVYWYAPHPATHWRVRVEGPARLFVEATYNRYHLILAGGRFRRLFVVRRREP